MSINLAPSQPSRGRLILTIVAALLTLVVMGAGVDTAKSDAVSIFVSPSAKPPVGSVVIVNCQGPLSNGGALVRIRPTKEGKNITRLLLFKVAMVKSLVSSKKMIPKAVISTIPGQLCGRNMTGSLDSDRDAINLPFKILYKDRGFYACQFFNLDRETVEQTTDVIFISAYYPARVKFLSVKQVAVNVTRHQYSANVSCTTFSGLPKGRAEMRVEGFAPNEVNVQRTTEEVALPGGVNGTRTHLSLALPVSMRLVNCTVTCTVGHAGGPDELPGNPRVASRNITLDLQVPATTPSIREPKRIFRQRGDFLECDSDGVPKPTIGWRVSGRPSDVQGPRIPVPSEANIYSVSCHANNTVLGEPMVVERAFTLAVVDNQVCAGSPSFGNSMGVIGWIVALIIGVVVLICVICWIFARKRRDYNKM